MIQNGADGNHEDDLEGPEQAASDPTLWRGRFLQRFAVLVLFCGLISTLYWQYGDDLSLQALVQKETVIRDYGMHHPWLIVGMAFLLYVVVTGCSLPAAAAFTMGIAWLFKLLFGEVEGFLIAYVVISFASTSGATLAFLTSRFLFRDAIQRKFGGRLEGFNASLEREGAFYLFTLRLIPAVPFFVINMVMGLTPIRVWTYWWVSQVGMLAGTAVYVYAGSQLPSLEVLAEQGAAGVMTLQIFIAFALLGLFPLVVKKVMGRFRTEVRSSTVS